MALKLIEAPTIEPVSLAQAVEHLNEHESPGEAVTAHISGLIATARETCEEYQNRAYLTQKWQLWFDGWPSVIELPRPPLQSVETVKWYDSDNTETTIEAADYFVDTNSEPGRIIPVKAWPIDLRSASGICITYFAGVEQAEKVPGRIKQAILFLVAEWYLNREASSLTGKAGSEKLNREIPFGVTRLLNFDRVMPV